MSLKDFLKTWIYWVRLMQLMYKDTFSLMTEGKTPDFVWYDSFLPILSEKLLLKGEFLCSPFATLLVAFIVLVIPIKIMYIFAY